MQVIKSVSSLLFSQKLAESLNIPYVETSAKDSINVHQAFNDFTAQLSSKSYHSTQESSDVLVKSTVESLAAYARVVSNSLHNSSFLFRTRKIKVVLLGDSGVGKTSLMTRLTVPSCRPSLNPIIDILCSRRIGSIQRSRKRLVSILYVSVTEALQTCFSPVSLFFRAATD